MYQRPMIITPLPEVNSKQLRIMGKMDSVISETFQAIRQLRDAIKSRCTGADIEADALTALLRASWAVENSQESAREIVLKHDKKSYKTYMNRIKGIKSHVEQIKDRCVAYQQMPFKLTAEVFLFGGDINVLMRDYK